MEETFLNPMVFSPRFCHITDQIFKQLDSKSLKNCKEVAKSWQEVINNKNLSWIQIINIPKIPQNGDTILHVCARTGQTEMFEKMLENGSDIHQENKKHETPFQLVYQYGHFKIAEMLLHKSTVFNIKS